MQFLRIRAATLFFMLGPRPHLLQCCLSQLRLPQSHIYLDLLGDEMGDPTGRSQSSRHL